MIYNLLSVDPAESTGYALVSIDTATNIASIFEYGLIDIDNEAGIIGDACNQMFDRIDQLIVKHDVKLMTCEDYFFSGKFASGSNMNPMYRAAVHMAARRHNLPVEVLNISAWKSFIAGRSVPTKQQKAKYGKEKAKKIFIQQALWERYGIRFPNHSISEKTGKPVFFKYDIVDAVAQAIYFCRLHLNLQVSCDVPAIPDVVFKKQPGKCFEYPVV